ncbi:MAG: S8 family serine peptidase [Chloroflexi bacterium]|nr:S8 family serine peptidase [Chloroflexota bacterium]
MKRLAGLLVAGLIVVGGTFGSASAAPTDGDVGVNALTDVSAYVIGSGIYTAHNDFAGQALNAYDPIGGPICNGQGTHTASVIGGMVYGEAFGVRLRGVRVGDCGLGPGLMTGISWTTNNAVHPALAHIPIVGSVNAALDAAVTNMVASGVVTVVPAGDSNADACSFSPARAFPAITVGSSTNTNVKSSFSNFGTCVDVYARGQSVTAAWNGSPTATATLSGTSVAAADVAGCVAKDLGINMTATPAQVHSWVIANAPLVGGIRIFTCPL